MARPRRYDRSALVDHAAALVAAGGPSAVTMTAVARASGAPSGSVYHRFPRRSSLLAELWLRTVEDFQDGFLAALAGGDPVEACVAAAQQVLRWSAEHPDSAAVLLHGEAAFGPDEWSPADRERAAANRERLRIAIAAVVGRLGLPDERADRVTLAVVDVPYAIVRRHGGDPSGIPDDAVGAVERCVRALLGAGAG